MIFEPSQIIRDLVKKIGKRRGLGPDWLNDAAKGYLVKDFKREKVRSLSNLMIWAPHPRYMLAMKCISARWDRSDKDDVLCLLKHLRMTSTRDVFELIERYYPKEVIPAKTQFLIEEILESNAKVHT
jgi:hypothetical protein